MTDTPLVILKYLQPDQYYSWLRKATDPEWDEEKFGCSTRSKAERAAAYFALELRECFERVAELEQKKNVLRDALEAAAASLECAGWRHNASDARKVLRATEGK